MTEDRGWQAANNGAGARRWFCLRSTPGERMPYEYHTNNRGDLIRYASMEAAQRTADRLNGSGR